jgi:hypothetical protein
MDLPEGWKPLGGVSGSGWDIWIGHCATEHSSRRYAIWYRRINFDSSRPQYTKGKTHPSRASAEAVLKQFVAEGFDASWIVDSTAAAYAADPSYGAF